MSKIYYTVFDQPPTTDFYVYYDVVLDDKVWLVHPSRFIDFKDIFSKFELVDFREYCKTSVYIEKYRVVTENRLKSLLPDIYFMF